MFERRIIMKIEERLLNQLQKPLCECSNQEIYDALLTMVQDMAKEKEYKEGKKKIYPELFIQ